MNATYKYKEQINPDGTIKPSWIKTVTDANGIICEKYMVYEDPNKSEFLKLIESATDEDLTFLANKLKDKLK